MNTYMFNRTNFLFEGGSTCPDQQTAFDNVLKDVETKLVERSEKLKTDVDRQIKDVNDDAPDPSTGEAILGFEIDVDWVLTELKFHVPVISFKDRNIGSLHLPVVEMERKDIIFHTPSIRMVPKKVGQYPELSCPGLKCTVTWHDIIIDVPETFMQEQKISLDLPNIKMEQKDIILGLPAVELELKTIKLHIPHFSIKNIKIEVKEAEARAQEIENGINNQIAEDRLKLKGELQEQLVAPHAALFDCIRSNFEVTKTQMVATLDGYITVNQTSIQKLKEQNVPNDNEHLKSLENTVSELMAQKSAVEKQLQVTLEQINNEQKESLDKIISGLLVEEPKELLDKTCPKDLSKLLNSLDKEDLLRLLISKK
ncbi:hypothetical protein ACN91_14955 [Bacillus cereus]|uniref:hypothetical protein n=1 Tax=Bacillus cereus TaxID=1396 RepID=UPI0006AD76B2|nr:hypothetical protein [Bacillus cereus]ALC52830.1 hypothetical protein ACN91_14955 [Bacillus cereus]